MMRSSLYRFCIAACKQGLTNYANTRTNRLNLSFLAPHIVSLSYSSSSRTRKHARVSKQTKVVDPQPLTEQESEAFYVVRKGDIIGVYKNFSDCQAQVSSSICDPSVGVYKGYSLPKETEEYLIARGLKYASYTINASDLKDDLFGDLAPCPFEQPDGPASLVEEPTEKPSPLRRSHDMEVAKGLEEQVKLAKSSKKKQKPLDTTSCIIEFDGASKGNPGKSGAGAVVRSKDGEVIAKLREGLGTATNNVAEYRALLLGLKYALEKGFKNIQVQGDSILVVKMVRGQWKGKMEHIINLCEEAKGLKNKFDSFEISCVKRELNGDADAQANLGAKLPTGEIQEESGTFF